jgi:predicted ABC-type ATPase
MEENILRVKIDIANNRVDFNIEAHFIAEDFEDDRLEKDVEVISSIKDRLRFTYYNNADQLTRIITEEFQARIPKLNLKWRLLFSYGI